MIFSKFCYLDLHRFLTACKSVRIWNLFFWSVFSHFRTEYGEIRSISWYSVRMRENTDQKTPNTDTFHAVSVSGPRSFSIFSSLTSFTDDNTISSISELLGKFSLKYTQTCLQRTCPYNGHLVMADTSLRKRPNRGQTVTEKPLFSGHIYSGHLLYKVGTAFEHRWNILDKIFLLIADTL